MKVIEQVISTNEKLFWLRLVVIIVSILFSKKLKKVKNFEILICLFIATFVFINMWNVREFFITCKTIL